MESRKTQSRHPEEEASFVSRLMLWWIIPLLWKGWRRPLQQEDLHQVRNKDQSSKFTERLEDNLEQEMTSAKRGIIICYYSHFEINCACSNLLCSGRFLHKSHSHGSDISKLFPELGL